MEFTLLGAAAVGVAGVYAALWWEARRGNAADCTADLWDIAIGAIVAGLVVGRLAAMVRNDVNPLTAPGDILIFRAGVDTGLAALTAVGVAAWLGRGELLAVLDGLAVAALAGLGGWHAGCLVRSSCLGTATDLPWAMSQPGSTVGRHPVELYAAAAYVGMAIVLGWLRSQRTWPPGFASGLALAGAGIVRLATEPMRPSLSGGPIAWYVVALVVGLGAAAVSWRQGASSPRGRRTVS